MVEFALVAALFFGFLFGAVEFGRVWYYSTHLENSVRAAARYGAVLTDAAQAPAPVATIITNTQGYATGEITAYLPAAGISRVVTTVNDSSNNPVAGTAVHGNIITVTAYYNFQVLPASIIPGFSGIYTLTRAASANYE